MGKRWKQWQILFSWTPKSQQSFPGGSDGKESACNEGDLGSIPESGRSPEEGHGNWLQYSCLEDSMDRRAWQAIVHGIRKSNAIKYTRLLVKLLSATADWAESAVTDPRSFLWKSFWNKLFLGKEEREKSENLAWNSGFKKLKSWHPVPSLYGK